MNKRFVTIILIGLIFASLGAFFRTATYDDGVHATTVQNTIGLKNPFYNNYEQVRHPFQRIQFSIFALGYTYLFPFNFKWPSLIHAILLCVSTLFVFVISRRYQDQLRSELTASLYFYFVYTMYWISPTRPEIWLTTIFLLIVFLTERFILFLKIKYIVIASIIIGTFGLTFHSNSWILYIYLILFVLFYREKFSRIDVRYIFLSTSLSSIVGLSIIFMPKPQEGLDFLLMMTQEGGNRITFLLNEIMRFRNFIYNPHHRYISYVFSILFLLWIYGNRKILISLQQYLFSKYKNVYLCFFAAFIGLGFLPSARWNVYLAYYYFPISFIASLLYTNMKLSRKQIIFFKVTIWILLIRFLIVKISTGQIFDIPELIKLSAYYFPLFLLSLIRGRLNIKLLYLMLIFGMTHQTFIMHKRWDIVKEISEYFIEHPNTRVYTNPEFDWLRLHHDDPWYLKRTNSDELNRGQALIGDNSHWVKLYLEDRSCRFVIADSIKLSFNSPAFLPEGYRQLLVCDYECSLSGENPIGGELSLKEYIEEQLNQD